MYLKIAICDDNEEIISKLNKIVQNHMKVKCIKYEIFTYIYPKPLLDSKDKYDIIFLDIDLGDENGIEIAKKIREYDKNVKIIFATSYTEYMSKAFSVHAFSYLTKPFKDEDVILCLDEAISYLETPKKSVKINLPTNNGDILIECDDIIHIESIARQLVITTTKTKLMTTTYNTNITKLLNLLPADEFKSPHRSFIVNLNYINAIKGHELNMCDGVIIPISKNKVLEFRKEFNNFLIRNIRG